MEGGGLASGVGYCRAIQFITEGAVSLTCIHPVTLIDIYIYKVILHTVTEIAGQDESFDPNIKEQVF